MKRNVILFCLFFLSGQIFAQSVAQQHCNNFGKGMNLSNWLEAYWQTGWPTANGYTHNDLVKMKEAGIKSLRLPICFASITDSLPPYNIDTNNILFTRIDTVIGWCNELNMNLILDNHHNWDIYNQNWRNKIDRFSHMWSVVSEHYKYLDPNRFTFELLNEPAFGIDIDSLKIVFDHAIDSIRQHTTTHSLIIGPNFSSNGAAFAFFQPLADTNLIYTWHSYDPYQFTHQGFAWATPPVPLGTTFPGQFDPALINSWNSIIAWKNTYNKPIFLGEFGTGVFGDSISRCNWIEFFGSKIDSFQTPWFYWDWQYDFSMFHSQIVSEDSIIPCFKSALHLYGDTVIASVNNLHSKEFNVELFPNPTLPEIGSKLMVGTKEATEVKVFDVSGRKVYSTEFSRSYILPTYTWQKGIYIVKIQMHGIVVAKKLVLE